MPPLASLASAAAILLAAIAAGAARRWWAADRVLARLGRSAVLGPAVPVRLAAALDRAGIPPAQQTALVRGWIGGVVVGVVAAGTLPAGPIAAAVVIAGPPAALLIGSGRAARRRVRDLPVALEAVVASLRSGHALPSALAAVGDQDGPVAAEFADIARRATGGRPLPDALRAWARTHEDHGTRLAAAAMAVAAEVGGPGADAIDAAAMSLRDRATIDDEIAALSVQAQASATLLSLTPIAFTALLATADPSSARFLFGTPVGWGCIIAGIGLDGLGAWWMQRLVRTAR